MDNRKIPTIISVTGLKSKNYPFIKQEDEEKLDVLFKASRHAIFQANSTFPFDLFPDHLSIEPAQVNFCKKSFFSTYHIQSIPIKNVADVFLQTSLFFASLRVIDSSYIENSIEIDYLSKQSASKARKIIQGLVVAIKNGIDTSKIKASELAQKAEKIGEAQNIDLAD